MAIDYNLLKLTPPEPTVKVMTAQDYLSGSQAIRDARRKKAIEFAMRSGIDAKGELNTEAMRQSLISQGFGENADQVVREVSMARLGDAATTAKTGADIAAAVEMGLIDPKIAENLFRNQIIETETEPPQTQTQIFQGVPGAKLPGEAGYVAPTQSTQPDVDADGNIIIRASGNGSSTVSQMTPPQEPRQFTARERGAQAVPDYISGFVKFGEKPQTVAATPSQEQASFTWQLPENTKDQARILEVAQNLGFKGQLSGIESWIYDTADSLVAREKYVPKKPGAEGYYEARAAQTLADSKRNADVAAKARNLSEYLFTGRNTDISQDIEREKLGFQRAAEARAKEKSELEKEQILKARNPELGNNVSTIEQSDRAKAANASFVQLLKVRDRIGTMLSRGETPSMSDIADFAQGAAKVADNVTTIDGAEKMIARVKGGPLSPEERNEFAAIKQSGSLLDIQQWAAKKLSSFYSNNPLTLQKVDIVLGEAEDQTRAKNGIGTAVTDLPEYKRYKPTAADYLGGKKPKSTGAAPATSGYSETKTNGAGMRMGKRKSDGKWEPIK